MQYLGRVKFLSITVVFLLALWPRAGWGQTVYGTLAGTVLDSSGAAVPGATVTLTNIGTSDKRIVGSDAAGSYTFVTFFRATIGSRRKKPASSTSNVSPSSWRSEAGSESTSRWKSGP